MRSKITYFIAAAILGMTINASAGQNEAPPKELIDEAVDVFTRSDPDELEIANYITQFTNLASRLGKYDVLKYPLERIQREAISDLYRDIGVYYRNMAQYDLADKHLQRSVQINTNNDISFYNLGRVYLKCSMFYEQKGQLKETKALLKRALPYYERSYNLNKNEGLKGFISKLKERIDSID